MNANQIKIQNTSDLEDLEYRQSFTVIATVVEADITATLSVDVTKCRKYGKPGKPISECPAEINWPGCGNRSPVYATAIAEALLKAVEVARYLDAGNYQLASLYASSF
jgi:hypothetical protein